MCSFVNSLDDLFDRAEGTKIPGGCDRCDAYQTVESSLLGVYIIRVHHDDWCPFLRQHRAHDN